MGKLEELGMGAANTATGQILGLAFGGIQDSRQRKQAQKLTDIQSAANRGLADYNQKLGKEMWDYTSYPNQVKKMEEAGLNVGLMYGGAGSGGSTAGAGSAGAVSGNSAGDPNAGVGMGLQMGAQIALMKAQKENIEADTINKQAEAENKGVQTEQGKLDLGINKFTENDKIETIQANAQRAISEADTKLKENIIKTDTYQEEIKQVRLKTAREMLENELTQGKINLTSAQINEIAEKLAQGWKGLEFQGVDKVTGKYIEKVADFMSKLMKGGQ